MRAMKSLALATANAGTSTQDRHLHELTQYWSQWRPHPHFGFVLYGARRNTAEHIRHKDSRVALWSNITHRTPRHNRPSYELLR